MLITIGDTEARSGRNGSGSSPAASTPPTPLNSEDNKNKDDRCEAVRDWLPAATTTGDVGGDLVGRNDNPGQVDVFS